jgi:CBS domain-containing protein
LKIGEALPKIFRATYPVLEPGTQMLVAVSLLRFHEIDALPIGFKSRQKKKLAVLGYSCLSKLQETPPKEYGKFLELPCEKAAVELSTVKKSETIKGLLRIFEQTKFGFAWIESQKLGGFASLRDLLDLYENGLISSDMTVGEVASPIFYMPASSTLKSVLREMFNHRFRRVFIEGKKAVVTDRKIINYIFSASKLTETAKKPETLLDAKLGDLSSSEPLPIKGTVGISKAASKMKDAIEECLICDKGVITPWDLLMKPMIAGKLQFKD